MTTAVTETAALLAASEALNVTVVAPTGKVVGASLVTVIAESTLSVATAPARNAAMVASLAATPAPLAAVTEISAGAVKTGAA